MGEAGTRLRSIRRRRRRCLREYSPPARRATSDSACCTSALARGKLTPIRIDGRPASRSSGLTLNQISLSGDAPLVATFTAASRGLASARRIPATAVTANIACVTINQLAACCVRRASDASGIRADARCPSARPSAAARTPRGIRRAGSWRGETTGSPCRAPRIR